MVDAMLEACSGESFFHIFALVNDFEAGPQAGYMVEPFTLFVYYFGPFGAVFWQPRTRCFLYHTFRLWFRSSRSLASVFCFLLPLKLW